MRSIVNHTITLAAVILFSLSLSACGSSSSSSGPDETSAADAGLNIVETAIDNGSFDTLVTALEAAEMDDDLQAAGPFTVFAPTDDAFSLLPEGLVDSLLEPDNQSLLIDVLNYHVVGESLLAADVTEQNGASITMLNSKKAAINIVDGEVIVNLGGNRQAKVTTTDISASNGVIHVIDFVLDPEDVRSNIVDTATSNGGFTTLLAALEAAELDDDLQGDGPFTVFAPTDAAFEALAPGTLDFLLETDNQATLIDLLLYHVFGGAVLADDAIAGNGTSLGMLNGENVTINVEGASVILNLGGDREAVVTLTDILCANGVIHVIDAVLDPGDTKGNIVDVAVENGNFTTLVTALQAAELDDDLRGAGPFTVFAPTDDAFAALPAGTVDFLLEPDNKETLVNILTYHVHSGSLLATDVIATDGNQINMLNGQDMSIDVVGGGVVLNLGGNRQANVVITDVLASNGIIHVIDVVLDTEDAP